MRFIKKVSKIFIIILITFVCNIMDARAAEPVYTDVCIGGSIYQFWTDNWDFDFYRLNDVGSRYTFKPGDANVHRLNIDGTEFHYQYTGAYQIGNNANLSARCYTYVDKSVTSKPGGGSTTNITVGTKKCGNRYGTILPNLKLVKQKDGKTDAEVTNIVDPTTGRISVVWKLDSKIDDEVWNRLRFVISYKGSSNAGSCTAYKEGSEKYIKCSNIAPYRANEAGNSFVYEVFLYLDQIKTSDFLEKVSDQEKQAFINSCGGANGSIYLGSITVPILSEESVQIKNPALSQPDIKNLCEQIKDIPANEKLKKAYVSECYSEKINYLEIANQRQSIQNKLKNLQTMFSGVSTEIALSQVASREKLMCTDKRMGIQLPFINNVGTEISSKGSIPFESKVVYENYDGYFGMICTEDYYVYGGVPSLVAAGTGVEYDNKVQINKVCSIFPLKQVTKKPQCRSYSSFEIRCDHNSDNSYDSNDVAGGPTSNFDACIEKCDGGKYTQSCINSCYQEVYSNNRGGMLSDISKTNFDFSKKYSLRNIAKSIWGLEGTLSGNNALGTVNGIGDKTPTSDGGYLQIVKGPFLKDYTGDGQIDFFGGPNDGKVQYFDKGGNLVAETGYYNGCGATCAAFDNSYSGPPGCSNNPDDDYYAELVKAEQELRNLESLAREYSQLEEYSISFTDSLTGDIYRVTGNTLLPDTDKPVLVIGKNNDLSKEEEKPTSYSIGLSGDVRDKKANISGISTTSMVTVYDVNIPISHVKTGEAELVVVENQYTDSDTNRYYSYEMNKNKHAEEFTFNRYSKYNPALFTNGKNVYFTNLRSPAYNVLLNSGKTEEELAKIANVRFSINGKKYIYELINHNTNIAVTLKVGHGKDSEFISFDSTKFYCYYGVYNFLTGSTQEWEPTPSPTISPSPTVPVPVSGLRYYYREIYLDPKQNGFGGIFPNDRNPRWNWTGTITDGVASGAANNSDSSYIVDPKKLIEDIEAKGEDIFYDESEYDYVFTMTKDVIKKIREYNKTKINGKKITYLDFSLVAASDNKRNYSQMVNEWYHELPASKLVEISECNNAKNGKCYIAK